MWRVFLQMIRALDVLHSRKILHRDLKSANVFLSKQTHAKLGDLNVSKVAKQGLLHTQTGTPYYASPEVWRDQPYDSKSDVWSLGCVLYEMCTLKPPFRAQSMNGLYKAVQKGSYDPIRQYSKQLNDMIGLLLSVDPARRPSCKQLLCMKEIKEIAVQQGIQLDSQDDSSLLINSANGEMISKEGLLQTIYVPKQLSNLGQKLPKSNYQVTQTVRKKAH